MNRSDFHVSLKEWTHPCPRGEGNFCPRPLNSRANHTVGTVSVTRGPQKLPAKLPASREFRRPVGGSCERVALITKELTSEVGRFCLGLRKQVLVGEIDVVLGADGLKHWAV